MNDNPDIDLIMHTANVAAAHVSNNTVAIEDMPRLITCIHGALAALGQPPAIPVEEFVPAVSVRSSVKHDRIISLIDGKAYKMLKRHLALNGLTPEQYRARYHLPIDYPMTAPEYAEHRRVLAIKIGLGRKPGQRRGRKPKAKAA